MTKVFVVFYENENFEEVMGVKQLKKFTQYRIDNFEGIERISKFYQDYNNLSIQECLKILEIDGYRVTEAEIE